VYNIKNKISTEKKSKLSLKAKKLKKEILTIYYAYKNPEINLLPKIIIIITLAYALSPIDLIPDFIPIIGYLDDLIIIPALISLSLSLIPKIIIEEARKEAENKPLNLKKNWFFAIVFILIWITFFVVIIFSIIKLIKLFIIK
jgi:uncharacterized membrane protein YkvA (DUF1232 family)